MDKFPDRETFRTMAGSVTGDLDDRTYDICKFLYEKIQSVDGGSDERLDEAESDITAIQTDITNLKGRIVSKDIAVTTGANTGSSEADATLIEGTVISIVPKAITESRKDSGAVISEAGVITLSLYTNATADSTYTVFVMKKTP